MAQMLATDIGNPEFIGAQNPDSALYVEFYMGKIIDKWRSDEETNAQGRRVTIYKKEFKLDPLTGKAEFSENDMVVPHIKIMRPGDDKTIIERPMLNTDKMRFPQQWMAFEVAEGLTGTAEDSVPGWKLSEWDYLAGKPDLLRDLKMMRFYTVEMMAGASDGQLQKLGSYGHGIRMEARKSIEARNRASESDKDKLIADMAKRLEALEKKGK
jgi:hypothetical protein